MKYFLCLLLLVSTVAHAAVTIGPPATGGSSGGATNGIQQLNGFGTNTTFSSSGATVPITVSQPNNAHSQNWDGNNNNHAFLDSNENFVTTALVHGSNITFKSIQDVGAVGTSDDTAVIQTAANLGQPIYFDSSVIYTVTNTIQFTNSTAFVGYGAIFKLAGGFNGDVINTSTNLTNCSLIGINFDGQRIGFTNSSGNAAWLSGGNTNVITSTVNARSAVRWNSTMLGGVIRDCFAYNFSDAGFRFVGGKGNAFIPTNGCTVAENLTAVNCYIGITTTNAAEYLTVVNPQAYGCGYGYLMSSANDTIIGGQLDSCGCGIRVMGISGFNTAHGKVIGTTLNHCSVFVACDEFNNGMDFDNCKMLVGGTGWQGFVTITNCAGVAFHGGIMSPTSGGFIVVSGGSGTLSSTNYFDNVIGIGVQGNPNYAAMPLVTTASGIAAVNASLFGVGSNITVGASESFSGAVTITNTDATQQTPLTIKGSTNDFYQLFMQNGHSGTNASTDFVLGNDQATATSTNFFIDFGINSSTYNGNIGVANDSYLYAASGSTNLNLGSVDAAGHIRIFVAGSTTNATVADFGSNNIVFKAPVTANGATVTNIPANGLGYTNQNSANGGTGTNFIFDLSGTPNVFINATNDVCATGVTNVAAYGSVSIVMTDVGATNHNFLFPTLWKQFGATNIVSSLQGTNSKIIVTNTQALSVVIKPLTIGVTPAATNTGIFFGESNN